MTVEALIPAGTGTAHPPRRPLPPEDRPDWPVYPACAPEEGANQSVQRRVADPAWPRVFPGL